MVVFCNLFNKSVLLVMYIIMFNSIKILSLIYIEEIIRRDRNYFVNGDDY